MSPASARATSLDPLPLGAPDGHLSHFNHPSRLPMDYINYSSDSSSASSVSIDIPIRPSSAQAQESGTVKAELDRSSLPPSSPSPSSALHQAQESIVHQGGSYQADEAPVSSATYRLPSNSLIRSTDLLTLANIRPPLALFPTVSRVSYRVVRRSA